MAQPKSEQVASLATQFENAFVLSLSITLVTTNAAPPGTAVNVFLLACVAGLLATVSGRLSRRVPRQTAESGASSLLWELGQHIVQLGAVLSTTIVSTFLGNYASAVLLEINTLVTSVSLLIVTTTLLFAIRKVLVQHA